MQRRVGARGAGVLLVALLLLASCREGVPPPVPSPDPTSPSTALPSPVSGLAVAVVLPPPSLVTPSEAEAMRADLEDLRDRFRGDVASLRVVQPDDAVFVADVADLLAERRADLVCVIGRGSGAAVRAVAPRYPGTEFCATPADAGEAGIPTNVLMIDIRVEEVAFLAGVAARLVDPDAAGPPGLIGGERQYALDRKRSAFLAGVEAVAAGPVTPFVGLPVGDQERAHELATAWSGAGSPAVYTVAGGADVGVLRAAEEGGMVVIGSRYTLVPQGPDGTVAEPSTAVLMTADLDVTVPVELALRRALEGWEGGRASVGLSDGAFDLRPGGSPRYREISAAVEQARARLEAGELAALPSS